MDFLNKALAQLTAAFRSMTPAGRIITTVLLAVLVISTAYLFNHPLTVGKGYLFGGDAVPATQLPAIEAAFGKKNLTDYELQGNRIRVPQGKQALYMAALADAGAATQFSRLAEEFARQRRPFCRSQKARRAHQSRTPGRALQNHRPNEWHRTHTVLYNVEMPQGFNAKKEITASVTVKPVGNQTLNPDQVQMIRQAVGPAIGTAPESIAIVDINGRAYPGGSADSANNSQDRYLSTKHQYEREYADSIRQSLLSFVKSAVVTVNVELHPEVEETESTDQFDPKSTSPEVPESSRTGAAGISLPSGIMNVATQGGAPNSPLTVAEVGNGLRAEKNSALPHDRDLLSRQFRQVRKVGLTPKSVTVSVGVPSSYYEEVCQQRFPPPAGVFAKRPNPALLAQVEADVNSNIKRTVLGIIPASEVPANDAVTITSFTSMPVANIEKTTPADRTLLWLTEHANAVGMGLLVVISLLIVRSIVRNLTTAARRDESNLGVNRLASDETLEDPRQTAPRRRTTSPLPNQLADIVREDPDAAANVLRNWIGSTN